MKKGETLAGDRDESAPEQEPPIQRIPIGVSSCLLGEEVRFDAGHKHSSYITGTLGRYFEFTSICPEMAIGLGAPRPTLRLVRRDGSIRVLGVKDANLDVTERLATFSRERVKQLGSLCGYILKKGSPSCGMERVKVYSEQGMPLAAGSGLFAEALMSAHPELPIEEEGRLGDPRLRENFIERVFVYHRWRQTMAEGVTPGRLVAFHSAHKLIVMAHNQVEYHNLGQLVADAGCGEIEARAARYFAQLMTALTQIATPRNHANVLMHLLGYLKRALDHSDKAELIEVIDNYRRGQLPLIVPITLLKHHFRRHPHPYIDGQYYLSPHPDELMLRNLI